MMPARWRVSTVALLVGVGCSERVAPAGSTTSSPAVSAAPASSPSVATSSSALERARAAGADLGKTLRGALEQQVAAHGPVAAIDFCRTQAPLLTQQVAQRHGVRLGRTSLRVRSATNTPSAWQEVVLSDFAGRVAPTTPPASLEHTAEVDGTLRWARGLRTEAVCTVCHGVSVAEPIAAAIARQYPGDRATGFAEGDLRGAVWVEIPLAGRARAAAPIAL